MRRRLPHSALLAMVALATALDGCAALPVAVVAGSLLDAGGGVLVKTGTEYTASGTARRTFPLPVDDVHTAVLETFAHAQIAVTHDDRAETRQRIEGVMRGRKVHVRLVPLTPMLTSMELDVKRNVIASDKATASELLAQTEHLIAERAAVVACAEQVPAPSSPRPAARTAHRHK